MPALDFQLFDTDNHFYESPDAFIRHVERPMQPRCMQWATLNGKERLLVGGKVNRFIPNPRWDPVAKPGSLDAYFRGKAPMGDDIRERFGDLDRLADHPEYQDRQARLRVMDSQGLGGCFMLPTLGVGMEQSLLGDPEAAVAALRAFNRWMQEDWGFAHEERIFAAPLISFLDVDAAEAELDFALEHDARAFLITTGPIITPSGGRSPSAPELERFWSKANEAGITVLLHSGDTYYTKLLGFWGRNTEMEAFRMDPFRGIMSANPIHDTVADFLASGHFMRFPNLRVASVENGSDWVGNLIYKLRRSYSMTPRAYAEDPVETLRRHVWVSPYYEENLRKLADDLGVDRIIMGSDWPHAEGLAEPRTYWDDLKAFEFTDEECRRIMRDNGVALTRRNAR